MRYRVYVDEAGDRGISASSSRHFVVSAVVVADSLDARLRNELGELRASLERRSEQVLHFVGLSHSQRLKAVQDVAGSSAEAVANVILDKSALHPAGEMSRLSRPDPMYLWALRLLVERVSWLVENRGGSNAIMTFAHLKRFQARKLHDYRRALEESSGTSISWRVYQGHPFRFGTPSEIELLQVADTTASATFKAVEPDRFGNTEPRYLEVLRPKLYRGDEPGITSYGLKTFPAAISKPDGHLAFLRDL